MAVRALDRVDLKEIQELLLERSGALEYDLAGLESETGGAGAERAGAHSAELRDLAELASAASERDHMYGLLQSQSGGLMEVRAALERLEKGAFGDCETCGDAIPLERLRAIPYARLCMTCKSAEERGESGIMP